MSIGVRFVPGSESDHGEGLIHQIAEWPLRIPEGCRAILVEPTARGPDARMHM